MMNLTKVEVDSLLYRYDQTDPKLQRDILVKFIELAVAGTDLATSCRKIVKDQDLAVANDIEQALKVYNNKTGRGV